MTTTEKLERIERIEGQRWCRHYECVAARSAELAAMGKIEEAVELGRDDEKQVRCRRAWG